MVHSLLDFILRESALPSEADRILLIHGRDAPRSDIRVALKMRYGFQECMLDDEAALSRQNPMIMLIDAPIDNEGEAQRIQAALRHLPSPITERAFILDDLSRASIVRAHAFGGEFIISRPLTGSSFYPLIEKLLVTARTRAWSSSGSKLETRGLYAGTEALEKIFQLASGGTEVTQRDLYGKGDAVIDALSETGIGRWVEAVKAHHSQTFRHCLLVTGVAVGFGLEIGLRHDDLQRLALGGMLHDIGKASIPVTILEKPGKLSPDETQIMQQHAALGRQILQKNGNFSEEMIDVVAHHHEFLDGSGYPDKLSGNGIPDLVRVMTISDIFAALIEPRSYKASLSNEEAYAILKNMDGKLDKALVRAFAPIAATTRIAA